MAKKTLADRRISVTLTNSAICFLGRLISACASDDFPATGNITVQPIVKSQFRTLDPG